MVSLESLFSVTKLPIVVKGVLRADDAELAVQHGVSAIAVSNHGGRQLDGVQATVYRIDWLNLISLLIDLNDLNRLMRFQRL